MNIFSRLKSEREKLGFTQPDVAELVGVGKTTVINWEKGASTPDATQLAKLSAAGADVVYILTGIDSTAHAKLRALQGRIGEGVDSGHDHATVVAAERVRTAAQRREADLLKQFQRADESGKKLIEGTAELAAKSSKKDRENES